MNWLSLHGISFAIRRKSCLFVRNLDNMKGSLFGAGLMLSERAAVERAAVERAAVERAAVVLLSGREKELIKILSKKDAPEP